LSKTQKTEMNETNNLRPHEKRENKVLDSNLECLDFNNNFYFISEFDVQSLLSKFRINMENSQTVGEREYWIGCIGGIRMALQKSKEGI